MRDFAAEIGRTVRNALGSNGRTARLVVLIVVVAYVFAHFTMARP